MASTPGKDARCPITFNNKNRVDSPEMAQWPAASPPVMQQRAASPPAMAQWPPASPPAVSQRAYACPQMPVMSQAGFEQYRNAAIQAVASDPEEIKKDMALERGMARDAFKSELRLREATFKENLRKSKIEILEKDQVILIWETNLNGQIVREFTVFHCLLKDVKRFAREPGEELFQFEIQVNGKLCYSELYGISYLKSPQKLKQTLLSQYVDMQARQVIALAWEWMWKNAMALYENQQQIICLPASPGWYSSGEKHLFWTRGRCDELYQSEAIKAHVLRYVKCQEGDLAKALKKVGDKDIGKAGALLVISLSALLERLCTEEPPLIGVILYGENALEVAKRLLSVSVSENNIINLDTDRINEIRSRVKAIREDVAIFIVTNPEGKSTQNRVKDVLSWFESGYSEGGRVAVPSIFCMKRLSPDISMENGIYIDADLISVSEWMDLFDILQSRWIDLIEGSGDYIVGRLADSLKRREATGGGRMLCLSKCIAEMTISCIQNEEPEKLQSIFEAGIQEIIAQSQAGQDYLESIFHDAVLQSVKERAIRFCECTGDSPYKKKAVYFDDQYYYFDKEVMELICSAVNMGDKAMLLLKQRLASQGYSKQYRSAGNRRELQVDISLYDVSGIKRHIPVFAVKREFWDEMGGVNLYEIGRY